MNDSPYPKAIAAASKIIDSLHITTPEHIDIEAIAGDLNAFVKYDSIEGSSARLVRRGSIGLITVSDNIKETGQKRFAIAHELGHYVLHQSQDQLLDCTEKMFLSWYKSRPEEPESNTFAAELLIPSQIFKTYCKELLPSFSEVSDLAARFNTTLTATAIRYVDYTPHPCVLVVSENKKVKWTHWRKDFPYRLIPKGTEIHEESCANDFFKNGQVSMKPEPLCGDIWLADWRLGRNLILYEQAMALPRYNAVLSLIWAAD